MCWFLCESMTKEKKTFQPLTREHICQIYNLLHKQGYLSFPLTTDAYAKVDATVANINGVDFDVPRYRTAEEKTVAYLYFLIKNHPFTDGNKRTATLVFLLLCDLNDFQIVLPETITLDALVVTMEQFTATDHHVFIRNLAARVLRPIS